MNDWISGERMQELTGTKMAAKQAEVLRKHGIFYIHRLDNTILTTEYHINNPKVKASAMTEEAPDFSSLEEA